ncbi:hypothetical protein MM59RIKEN_26930 [Pusillibacter faecalis]|uniref:Uncharacterized protein n=1 Tax=Pusillibacter faecalis TaxID=2714358 RepID=A0A810QBL8_9FIRM|nr:hypothetical protein [Pusillibacter faecalis]BCK85374.1 hypothetical protein MM59RIKEN_26930 [Pusillibacter faecalis]
MASTWTKEEMEQGFTESSKPHKVYPNTPDMSKRPDLAGQTVEQTTTSGKYKVTYDESGYAVKGTNTSHELFNDSGSSGGGGGGSSGGSHSRGGSVSDLSEYLNAMYAANTQAQLAALQSAYEQNLAGLQANAEKIPVTYQAARNEAASQNEIARQAFNEYANARGLNTGTSGQAALANSATLQGNLSDISTQESNALAENALQQQLLAVEYRNAAAQAQAQGNAQLAQALYSEYVRQDDASMQLAQLAQEQANWEAQFNTANNQWNQQFQASQQQYQDSLAAQNREYAYNLAMTMLGAGIMPDNATLTQAGISSSDALSMRMAALQGGSSGSRSSSSGRTSPSRSQTKNNTVTVDYANLPDYDTILKNSSAGLYGSQYGHTLQMVQNMIRNGNSDAEIKNYLTQQLDGGKINEDGLATILQALGNERE